MKEQTASILTPELIDEERAAERLAGLVRRKPTCPRCGFEHMPAGYFTGRFVRCRKCGKKFTWRTGTIFEGAKLTAAQIVFIFDRLTPAVTDEALAERAKITADTVRVWRFKYSLINGGSKAN